MFRLILPDIIIMEANSAHVTPSHTGATWHQHVAQEYFTWAETPQKNLYCYFCSNRLKQCAWSTDIFHTARCEIKYIRMNIGFLNSESCLNELNNIYIVILCVLWRILNHNVLYNIDCENLHWLPLMCLPLWSGILFWNGCQPTRGFSWRPRPHMTTWSRLM